LSPLLRERREREQHKKKKNPNRRKTGPAENQSDIGRKGRREAKPSLSTRRWQEFVNYLRGREKREERAVPDRLNMKNGIPREGTKQVSQGKGRTTKKRAAQRKAEL